MKAFFAYHKLCEQNKNIVIMWTHVCIQGNTRADKLAKEAITRVDILVDILVWKIVRHEKWCWIMR